MLRAYSSVVPGREKLVLVGHGYLNHTYPSVSKQFGREEQEIHVLIGTLVANHLEGGRDPTSFVWVADYVKR